MPKVIMNKGGDILVYSANSWYSKLQYENKIRTVAISEGDNQTTPNIHSSDIIWGRNHTIVQYAI